MHEASKARTRLAKEGMYARYINGTILDVGCGGDKIHPTAYGWDKEQGDAQLLEGVPNDSIDCLFSSHALEHMVDARAAISRWWEVVKPEGYLFVIIPDEDLYEQGYWPSIFNSDHKHTFTLSKTGSWSPVSINVVDLVKSLPNHRLVSARLIDTNYNHAAPHTSDQSLGDVEVAIEFIVQKLPSSPPDA